jgi:hypothetical protein
MERVTVLRRTAVALLLVAPTLVLAGPSPVADAAPAVGPAARSGACMELDPKDLDADLLRSYAENADDAFAGKVLDRTTRTTKARKAGQSHTVRTYTHSVRVENVFSGDLGSGDRVMLVTHESGTRDGLGPLHVGSTYLLFTRDADLGKNVATVTAVDCAGTTELPDGLSAGLRDQIEQLLADDSTPTTAPVLSDPADGASEPPAYGRTIAPGIALALLGVLGLAFFSWLGRRRA